MFDCVVCHTLMVFTPKVQLVCDTDKDVRQNFCCVVQDLELDLELSVDTKDGIFSYLREKLRRKFGRMAEKTYLCTRIQQNTMAG